MREHEEMLILFLASFSILGLCGNWGHVFLASRCGTYQSTPGGHYRDRIDHNLRVRQSEMQCVYIREELSQRIPQYLDIYA